MTRTAIAIRQNLPVEFDLERPWTRQPFDTDARWRAFLVYREQPVPRTIRRTSELLADPMTEKPYDPRTLEKWSTAHAWPERCAEYDRYLDEQRVAATVEILNEDARRSAAFHCELLRKAQVACASVVEEWLGRLARGERLDGWSPNDVRGMLKDTITLERLIRGQATERVDTTLQLNLERLSVEELKLLLTLQEKAGAVVD